jgi:hypothetical protein
MLSFDKKKLSFKFNEEIQEIEYPTVKKINSFRKELKKDGADEVDCTINFLCDLGAKKDVIEALRVSQLNALVEEITQELSDSKKN